MAASGIITRIVRGVACCTETGRSGVRSCSEMQSVTSKRSCHCRLRGTVSSLRGNANSKAPVPYRCVWPSFGSLRTRAGHGRSSNRGPARRPPRVRVQQARRELAYQRGARCCGEENLRRLALENDEPSVRASTVRLLASMSTSQSQGLAEELLAAERRRSGPPRFALDILTNRIRPARDLMRDVLRMSNG